MIIIVTVVCLKYILDSVSNYLPSCWSKPMTCFQLNTKENILIFFCAYKMEMNGHQNYSFTNILQDIFCFCFFCTEERAFF